MVTLRRDVAAAARNTIFDKSAHDCELTDYDIFMQQKKKNDNRAKVLENTAAAPQDCLYTDNYTMSYNYFGKPQAAVEVPKKTNDYADYKDYLKAQLNRTAPGKLLSREEFYSEKKEPSTIPAVKTKRERIHTTHKQLTKNGKIFIAVYVLAVALIASIILVVNRTVAPGRVDAGTVRDGEQQVAPLVSQDEAEETNWFDKLLDSISNG